MAMTSNKGKVPTGFATEIALSDSSFRESHRAVQIAGERPPKKRKRENKGSSSTVFGAGSYKGPWARYEQEHVDSSSEEEVEVEVEYEEDEILPQPDRIFRAMSDVIESVILIYVSFEPFQFSLTRLDLGFS